ncbi:MAG: hypothetical protein Q8S26_13580 [Azonexus sp.]|nr:hypothetical protein [Azonexus sp.]
MQFPITIGLRRSRFLDGFVFLSALLASGATAFLNQSPTVQMAFLLAIWLCGSLAWHRLSPRFSAMRLERNGQISVVCVGMDEFSAAELLPQATVHPWLTVFRLKTEGGRSQTLVAAVDSLKTEDFRRLRMFLRWRGDFSDPKDDA